MNFNRQPRHDEFTALFAPATIELMFTWTRRLPRSTSGTSPLAIRCASHSTIAVLPTPGSPQNGIVLVGFALAYGAFVHGLRATSGSWPSAPSR
ncbi:hypothetical protein [Paraburkholderia hospita]|uniref:hypothetical protein n=1 Tax=Paraburkholderia hospita TaxID=169430 RepID=UPI003ECE76EA